MLVPKNEIHKEGTTFFQNKCSFQTKIMFSDLKDYIEYLGKVYNWLHALSDSGVEDCSS